MNRQERSLNTLLNHFTVNNVQLRRNRKTEVLNSWQPIVDAIVERVKRSDQRFDRLQILPTGSYYERAKVGEPDEFDLMLVMDNLELDGEPYDEGEHDGLNEPPTGKKSRLLQYRLYISFLLAQICCHNISQRGQITISSRIF